MGSLTIRNIHPETYQRLKEQARRHRRSITQEAAVIIEEAVARTLDPQEFWRHARRVREAVQAGYGAFPDSAPLIREDRRR